MTGSVNSLTDRARTRRAATARNPQVLSGFRPLFDAFERLGCDRAGLMRAAGLTPGDLNDPDAILSDAACMAFFQEAGRQRPVPNFALRVAEQIPIGAYPLLDYLVMTSDTVGKGFDQLMRYLRLVGSPGELRIDDDGDPILVRLAICSPFTAEFTLSLAILHFRRETGGAFRAASLHFRHRPDDPADFERLLACPVHTGAEADALAIARAVWRLPLRRRDSVLHQVLTSQAEETLARRGSDGRVSTRLRRELSSAMSRGGVDLATLARRLGSSPRTLQRRLEEEGTTFQEVLDEVRSEAAEGYLADSSISCAEIGYLLGFSEPAAFHRAFRRWRGVTPREYRSRIRSAP
jgi:AraC-like DNA-binding protein